MTHFRFALLACLSVVLASCAAGKDKSAIGQLEGVKIDLKDEKVEDNLSTMQSYQRVLEMNTESDMTPEAMQHLADFKVQRELEAPEGGAADKKGAAAQNDVEDDTASGEHGDKQPVGVVEAIGLYKKILEKYPAYERREQVMYQLSRAYEELGDTEAAIKIMNWMSMDYPGTHYADEIQFRRGEYFFTRKKFKDAAEAYKAVVKIGAESSYYELALYKLGWTYYKQELYTEALHRFVALLDYKVGKGYDLDYPQGTEDEKRVEDTFRVMSLAFSNLGGADAITAYFDKQGKRAFEVNIYSNLAEHYVEKRRYNDAVASYKTYVKRNPYARVAPRFDARVNEIYKLGGFPRLVIESNKNLVADYGAQSGYWKHVDIHTHPEAQGIVRASLKDLANYYHSLYQDKSLEKNRDENFREAMKWYREFLASSPRDTESSAINHQLAELLLENKGYEQAAEEYEHTAYDYPAHEKASADGYAAVYARRQSLAAAAQDERERTRLAIIGSSYRFADTFPQHEKAALVLGAAVDDIFGIKEYPFAVEAGRKLLADFPRADQAIRRSAWLVIAHASFEQAHYKDAEEGYLSALQLMPEKDPSRDGLAENLAASVYKQGEEANRLGDFKTAAGHFLRTGKLAAGSAIHSTSDYDGATALMQLKDWDKAADVLRAFRRNYPEHKLQPEVTKKLAFIYQETGKPLLAAAEYERIETESQDAEIRRSALQLASDMYAKANETDKALRVYRRYEENFPKPVEPLLEIRNKIALILKARNDTAGYLKELKQIVADETDAGAERSARTRYIAGTSALVLTEPLFGKFAAIQLAKPFNKNLLKKTNALKTAKEAFENLVSYEVGDVTSAATYYIAEMYYNFSRSLVDSERPEGLDDMEKEQYELSIEEQSYPFEQKAIQTHEKNLELLTLDIYTPWTEKSLEKLAKLMPARYAKFEESSGFIEEIAPAAKPVLAELPMAPAVQPVQDGQVQAAQVPGAQLAPAQNAVEPKPQSAPTQGKTE